MDGCLVSVVIPVYKVEPWLDACVSSVARQSYRNIEIILVDDGSPDNCPQMCDRWAKSDSRIRVIHKENGGLSSARNAGILAAQGKWVVFVDSDDMVDQRLVESLVKESGDSSVLVTTALRRITTEQEVSQADFQSSTCRVCAPEHLGKCRGGMYVWGVLYSKDLIDKLCLQFDTSLRNLEDVAWNGMYLRHVQSVCMIEEALYLYRITPGSITSRCVDVRWQINSWLSVRSSTLNWWRDQELTGERRKGMDKFFRHIQNNIYGECAAGGISYNEFRHLEKLHLQEHPLCLDVLPLHERWLISMPFLYYHVYVMLLRMRGLCGRKKS